MTARKPSPAVMIGRTDPALTVRPVDYSSWKPTTPPPAAPPQGTAAASAPDTPVSLAANPRMTGPPKPGPGPRKYPRVVPRRHPVRALFLVVLLLLAVAAVVWAVVLS